MLDGQGRRILFGHLHEGRYGYVQRATGWAGIFALPMVLTLAEDGDLHIAPVPELEKLRHQHFSLSNLSLAADQPVSLDIHGDQLEIRAIFEWKDAEEFGLKVCCSPDGEEQTQIRFIAKELILDVTRSSTSPAVCNRESQRCRFDDPAEPRELLDVTRSSTSPTVSNPASQHPRFDFDPLEPLELRVFVDRSVIEVFANGRHYLAMRIYPARKDSLGVQVFALGGGATLRSLDVWEMAAVWPVE